MSMEATLATWELKKSQVNSREKFFLLMLARRAGEDHTCWPSIARMLEDTGFDRKTLIDLRQDLINRKLISYTGRMVGRSKQIPEMMLNYVQKWEKERNSPRLKDDNESVDNSTIVSLTSPKNGTGTSPKNGTLNSKEEYKNRNKSLYIVEDQKKSNVKEWPGLAPTAKKVSPLLEEALKKKGISSTNDQTQKTHENKTLRRRNCVLPTVLSTENGDNLGKIE